MFPQGYRIIDISQPVDEKTACFPGDVPFSRQLTVSYDSSEVMNLTALTMSPHVGTHADAPVHVRGDMSVSVETAGTLPLEPFIGPAVVIDVSPYMADINWEKVAGKIDAYDPLPPRVLFRSQVTLRYDVFEKNYAWLSVDLVVALAERGVTLVGLDTPSVDHIDSKTLETHHALLMAGMVWLENLDLTQAPEGEGFLIAPPLKFTSLEASPVRALLLAPQS